MRAIHAERRELEEARRQLSERETAGRSDPLADQMQRVMDALPEGEIAFHHPQVMQLRRQEGVQIRISQDLKQDIARGLSSLGVTDRDQLRISASMKVRLSGDPNFDVRPLSDEEQLVAKDGYTEWSFIVTPLKSGKWPLHLVVTAVVRSPGGTEKYKDYPVKDEVIEVRVSTFGAVGFFVEDNWQWLWTAILIPLAVWGWKIRAKARKRKLATVETGAVVSSAPVVAQAPTPEPDSSKVNGDEDKPAAQKSA
jgi:hypothetical protein